MVCVSLLAVFSCGNESLLQPARKEAADFQIEGISDGQVIAPGDSVSLKVSAASSQKNKDLELGITVYSASGEKVWNTRLTTSVLNEPLPPLALPELADGQYRMEIVLFSAGEEIQKKSAVFLNSKVKYRIAGIKSFPAVIKTDSAVLLKAELEIPEKSDPYLRWTWRGKTIAKGMASQGLTRFLWTAPNEEGVYTITLELFPFVPVEGAAGELRSSLAMATDVYVSSGKGPASSELAPQNSYYALFGMQANLQDSGTAAKAGTKKEASLIGSPEIVPTDNGFGYRVSNGGGILIPRFILPVEEGALKPFTLSMGVKFESAPGENRILAIKSPDGFSFLVTLPQDTLSPQLTLSFAGVRSLTVPARAPLTKEQRHLLSISLVPWLGGLTVQWFVDGEQTNAAVFSATLPLLGGEGSCVIAGEKGFTGTVDELAVYCRNSDGKPSSDPDLYKRAARAKFADAVVLAEGFDSVSIPEGFTLEGGGEIAAGALTLPAGAEIGLPPFTAAGEGMSARIFLSAESAQTATLLLRWEGEEKTALEAPLSARAGEIRFSFQGGKLTYQGSGGQPKTAKVAVPSPKANLAALLQGPKGGRPLIVKQILMLHEK